MNRKGPWGRGCIEIDIAIFGFSIHDDGDDNVELPSQVYLLCCLDPYSIPKILETYNQFNKSSEYPRYYGLDH